jgi:uncharacterized protein
VTLIVDAGPLYAYYDADDKHHTACLALLDGDPGPLVVPALAVTEVAYLVGRRAGWRAEVTLLGDIARGGVIVEPVRPPDWLRTAELVARYRDFPLGTVDASVVACAERLGVGRIATVDRRHFGAIRPRHVPEFELLPA